MYLGLEINDGTGFRRMGVPIVEIPHSLLITRTSHCIMMHPINEGICKQLENCCSNIEFEGGGSSG